MNLLIGSASAKWALIGAIMVPMLMQLGVSPDLTQAAYRVGDSLDQHHHAADAVLPADRGVLPALREVQRHRHADRAGECTGDDLRRHDRRGGHAVLTTPCAAFDAAAPANVSGDSNTATVTTPANPPTSGLDSRPLNTTCIAPARPTAGSGLQFVRVFANLSFSSPVGLYQAPRDTSRWFVVQQGGVIRTFPNDPGAQAAQVQTYLDLTARVTSGGERGLLGFAFHPELADGAACVRLLHVDGKRLALGPPSRARPKSAARVRKAIDFE